MLLKIGPLVLEKQHDDGRQPLAIGHMSDSGDLKMFSTPGHEPNKLELVCSNYD